MAHRYELSQQDIDGLTAFIEEGKTAVLETGATEKLYALSAAVARKMQEYCIEQRKKNAKLDKKLCLYQAKERLDMMNGEFSFNETELDSLDVAAALIHCLQRTSGKYISKNKVIYILYNMYCSWLANKKERMFTEHPACTEWGPQFWRVYKHIDNPNNVIPYDAFKKLAEQNPAVAAFCRNTAEKYYDYTEKELKLKFTESEPYKNALPVHNNGKWGKQIADTDIYLWKNSQHNG